jgi:site-specific DNA recombinase
MRSEGLSKVLRRRSALQVVLEHLRTEGSSTQIQEESPMKVAAYARYSTAEQDKISIAAQLANVEALCGKEGFTIVSRFQDEARQGSDDRRPGYRAMLAALERGDFDGIVADETSRITRNQSELHRLVAELRYRERFLATADGIDTRSETSEIVLSVRAAIDSMESKRIGYRVFRSSKEATRAAMRAVAEPTGIRLCGR